MAVCPVCPVSVQVEAMGRQLHSKNVTVKIRTGWDDKTPTAHKLLPDLQKIQ